MFQFGFQNIAGFLIAFVPGLINLCLVIFIFTALPRNRLINVFAIFTLCAGIWQINDALCRVSTSAEMADAWDSLLCAGWIFTGPLCLHFSLLYTKVIKDQISPWLAGLLYIPAFVFLGIYQTHLFEHKYQYRDLWGWVNYHDQAVVDIVMIYWISILVLISCGVLFHYVYRVRKDALLRNQAIIIALGISIPTFAGVISQVVFPTLLNRPSVPVTSSFLTSLSLATVIALKRYRLFSISELVSNELLLNELPVIVVSVSDTGHINYVNHFGAETFGLEKHLTRRIKFNAVLKHAVAEHEVVLKDIYSQALKGETVRDVESALVIEKRVINVLISSSPIVNNNKVRGALLCIRDITALKNSESSLQEKNIQLRQKNANLEEFAFVASHDLKEPLRKIITFTGMIEKAEMDRLTEKSRIYFSRISEASRRMQAMIDDLLSLSIISQDDRMEFQNLNKLINEAVKDLEFKIAEKNATIDVSELPYAFVNPKQFRQLFLNLISNSLKFSRKDVRPVVLIRGDMLTNQEAEHLSLVRNTRYVKIIVEDNGIGFENVYAEKMFQLFQRLHGKVDYEGTGIGLAICKKIVEQHKGMIYASGVLNQGATFSIIIPYEPVS